MARSLAERLRKHRVWSTEFRCWTLSEQGTLNSEQPYEARREKLERVFEAARNVMISKEFCFLELQDALAAVPEIPEE